MIQASPSASRSRQGDRQRASWTILLILTALLILSDLPPLWRVWRSDPSLAHGPLIPVITLSLLWMRRCELQRWNAASSSGLAFLLSCVALRMAAVAADVVFLQSLSLIGMLAGVLWFLGGTGARDAAAGALGFLIFMLPWPTTLVAYLALPLQLTSSAYAALFGGLLGLPIHRDGVHLAVVPDPYSAPVYGITVARQCSGLMSLTILLALGYLVAYHTPIRAAGRAALLATVVPLAILTNAIRLTIILVAGTYHGAAIAGWLHDHEAPVLIFLCSLGLMGLRHTLLTRTGPHPHAGGNVDSQASPAGG
jgi:exosortase